MGPGADEVVIPGDEIVVELWQVKGTELQLDKLEDFMVSIGVTWDYITTDKPDE